MFHLEKIKQPIYFLGVCSRDDLKTIIEGPALLKLSEKHWPKPPINKLVVDVEELSVHVIKPIAIDKPFINPNQFSSWSKLVSVTCYVQRFIRLCRKQIVIKELNQLENEVYYNPGKEEITVAENYWIRWAQLELPTYKSKLEKLVPFIDMSNVQRVTGRLRESYIFDYDQKHPVLLPPDNHISTLILRDIHEKLFHPGHNRVLAESRKRFWIINARRIAKTIGNKCVTCRRWRGQHLTQIMADLPPFRIKPGGAPFESSSVDYFGPFLIRYGRRQRTKAYGVIITCLVTRAIYLDVALSLTTESFLMAFRRFISLYGQPTFIRSDNGSNFRGAAGEIREMLKKWKLNTAEFNKLKSFAASYHVQWTFSTPLASHHNGPVESLIKSVKFSLNKVVKGCVLTEEEYRTILAEVQCSINSRPLWPSTDVDVDEPPITCHDLLRPKGLIRENDALNISNPRTRYGNIQRVVNEWWKIWMNNFVPNLQIRSKWFKQRENIQVGDIVLNIDKNVSRSNWQMAVVVETYKGHDGNTRSVKIKTTTGCYDRPITKLCLLLSKEECENK